MLRGNAVQVPNEGSWRGLPIVCQIADMRGILRKLQIKFDISEIADKICPPPRLTPMRGVGVGVPAQAPPPSGGGVAHALKFSLIQMSTQLWNRHTWPTYATSGGNVLVKDEGQWKDHAARSIREAGKREQG